MIVMRIKWDRTRPISTLSIYYRRIIIIIITVKMEKQLNLQLCLKTNRMWHWLEAALTIALTLGKYCSKYFLYISSFNTTMLQGNIIIIPILLIRIIQWSWGHTTRQLQHKDSNPGHMILEFIFSTMILCGFWKETVREGECYSYYTFLQWLYSSN